MNTPVVMIECADYCCPFCGMFVLETQPAPVKDHVDTGKLRIK